MKLIGARGQQVRDFFYDASGTITTGGDPQLVLAESKSRSFFLFQNLSSGPMYLEFGSARATATLTGSAVTSIAVTNGGFGFTYAPSIFLLGGGTQGNSTMLGVGQPNYPAGTNAATAVATLAAGSVSAITVNYGGIGYSRAPYVFIQNSLLDPYGCATPSATSGILINAQDRPLILNGTSCITDAVAVFGPTTGAGFTCKWLD